jgi:hypothetical protein
MKKYGVVTVLALAFCIAVPSFTSAQDDSVKHGELAQLMVRVLGLQRHLPPNPTNADCFAILLVNRIVPQDGWRHGEVVTAGDLARVVVQAMGESENIENPDDPASWVNYLNEQGIEVVDLHETATQVSPLAEAVTPTYEPVNVDPFSRRRVVAQPDERQLAGDFGIMSTEVPFGTLVRVLRVVEPPAVRRPRPVTPNEPQEVIVPFSL